MSELQNLWDRIRSNLKDKTTNKKQIEAWLDPTSLEAIEENAQGKVFRVGVPGPLYRDWIMSHVMPQLQQEIATSCQGAFAIELVLSSQATAAVDEVIAHHPDQSVQVSAPTGEKEEATPRRDLLNPDYTFSTFVVGQGNSFAHAACFSVAEKPGKNVNPLFVWGPSGMGKTHLLNAIGHHVREKFPNIRICYISGERFLNEVVSSIRHRSMENFRQRYRERYDFFILDDIHVIARTDSTQEEFFYTFNAFHEAGKQFVIASDRLPREMDGLEERIRTRLEWGLTVDIQPPDYETRMAILRYKAERQHLEVPDDVISLIAQISKKSVRELEGNLSTIRMLSELKGVPITLTLAKDTFSNILQSQKQGLNIEEVQRIVAEHFAITIRDLKSSSRAKPIVGPRQIAMYLARKVLEMGYAEIGRAFGNRDHTTVLHAEAKVKDRMADDVDFRSEVNRLENLLNNSQWTVL